MVFLIFGFSANAVNPEVKDSIPDNSGNYQVQFLASSEVAGFDIINAHDIEIISEPVANEPIEIHKTHSPWGIPSFLWSFVLSAIGAFTIYGLGLGPLSVLIVYFASKKSKKEVRKSVWGWIVGTVVGLGLWILLKFIQYS